MIWSIQVLRFVAALMVVYIHSAVIAVRAAGSTGSVPAWIADLGHIGVDIFFVISGVIITKISLRRSPSEFIWSRIIRIVPLYFLLSVIALTTNVAISEFSWRELVATFLFWPATDKFTIPALNVGWTLCFEMLFYVFAALVLVNRWWVLAIIAMCGVAFVLRSNGPPFQFLGNPIILEFVLGVAIAFMPSWRGGIWAIPLAAIWLVGARSMGITPAAQSMDVLIGNDNLERVMIFGLPSAMIVFGTMQVKARKGVLAYLGEVSYSLYLTHTFILLLLLSVWSKLPMPPDLIILIGVSASVLFAWRVHELIEKPIMLGLKNQLWSGRGIKHCPNG